MLAETPALRVFGERVPAMKVSILVPTCRRPRMLAEALASARAQTYGDVEIVVSDDGGDDETQRLVAAEARVDSRVRLAPKNPRPGLFSNFNHLLDQSRGDAFFFLCDDDKLLPHCIERLVNALLTHPEAVAALGEFWFCDVEGRHLEAESRRHLADAGRIGVEEGIWPGVLRQAMIAKLNVGCGLFRAKELGFPRFDLECRTVADVDLWVRTALIGPVYYIPERLAEIRQHPQSISAGPLEPILSGMIYLLTKHAGKVPELELERLTVLQIFRASYAWQLAADEAPRVRRVVRDYLRDAAKVPHFPGIPAILAAALITALPPNVARPVRRVTEQLKQLIRA